MVSMCFRGFQTGIDVRHCGSRRCSDRSRRRQQCTNENVSTECGKRWTEGALFFVPQFCLPLRETAAMTRCMEDQAHAKLGFGHIRANVNVRIHLGLVCSSRMQKSKRSNTKASINSRKVRQTCQPRWPHQDMMDCKSGGRMT